MKLFSRRKKNKALLADVDIREPSFYKELDEEPRAIACETEERDERNKVDSNRCTSTPYQITHAVTNSTRIYNKSSDTVTTEKDITSDAQLTEKVSFHVEDWEEKPLDTMKRKTSKGKSQSIATVIPDKSLISPSSGSRTGDDIFDDLESEVDEVDQEDRFLAGFLGDGMTVASKDLNNRPMSGNSSNLFDGAKLKSDLDEHSAEGLLNTLTSPVSSAHLNRVSKGILIVDPNKNGEVYRMDEDNKSLTDKDLIIIGHDEDQDDTTVLSTLTDVTYQKSKEERAKIIAQHLRNSSGKIPTRNPFLSVFGCMPCSSSGLQYDVGNEAEEFDEEKVTEAIESNQAQFSLNQDGRALFQSLIGSKVDYGSFHEKIIVFITRVYLLVGENDHGLRCTYNDSNLSHDLGVQLIEDIDGQAVVAKVVPESTAERSGVRIGDKLSFSVPLNNTFQGYERACDFISRLELIGMRTSYRELFEMFLSKTSSGWPVAIVFRRKSEGMLKVKRIPFGLPSMDMSVDLLRAATSLHEVITSCREFDYAQESNGADIIVRGNIETFIPRPRYTNEKITISLHLEPRFFRIPLVPTCSNSNIKKLNEVLFSREFRRSPLLTWYAENSNAMLYMKITNNKGGSGLVIARNVNGWSAPCAVIGSLQGGSFQYTEEIDCFIFWSSPEHMKKFKEEKTIEIDTENSLSDFIVITKISGVFYVETRMKVSLKVRDDINTMIYQNVKDLDTKKILEGNVSNPGIAATFSGALRRLEFPSTMYPHPTPPTNLTKFTFSKWDRKSSAMSTEALECPFDEEGRITLRTFLRIIERGSKVHREDKIELDKFMLNFNRMLYDGVTVERTWISEKGNVCSKDRFPSKVLMKLCHLPDNSWEFATIQFSMRGNNSFDNKDFKPSADFQFPLRNIEAGAEIFKLNEVTSISNAMSDKIMSCEKNEDELKKLQKRYVSFEMIDETKVTLLARTGKDASLLSCGLKLLIERVQINL